MTQPTAAPVLPDPEAEPTVDLWPTAARALGVGRNTAYAMVQSGALPSVRCGRSIRVPTAALRKMLHLEESA